MKMMASADVREQLLLPNITNLRVCDEKMARKINSTVTLARRVSPVDSPLDTAAQALQGTASGFFAARFRTIAEQSTVAPARTAIDDLKVRRKGNSRQSLQTPPPLLQ